MSNHSKKNTFSSYFQQSSIHVDPENLTNSHHHNLPMIFIWHNCFNRV